MKALMNPHFAVSAGRVAPGPRPPLDHCGGWLAGRAAAGCSAAARPDPRSSAAAHGCVRPGPGPGPRSRGRSGAAPVSAIRAARVAGNAGSARPGAQAIVYTASLTVRAADISRAASQAERIATAAGGYVSNENTLLDKAHPAQSTISLQLRIPVAAYQATLGELSSRLGTRVSVSQQAQDVTATVADVTSRVTSAQAAISQLRALLARAARSATCSPCRTRSTRKSRTSNPCSPASGPSLMRPVTRP